MIHLSVRHKDNSQDSDARTGTYSIIGWFNQAKGPRWFSEFQDCWGVADDVNTTVSLAMSVELCHAPVVVSVVSLSLNT